MDESERLSTIIALQDHLTHNEAGTDLLLSSLVAAASCSRKHAVCSPFPRELYPTDNADKDLRGLCTDTTTLPATKQLQDFECLSGQTDRTLQLLRWLLLRTTRRRVLQPIPIADLQQLLHGRCSGWDKLFNRDYLQPSAVFKLENCAEQQFKDRVLAFHGTSFENLYSILQNGLLNLTGTLLQRTGANHGDGIYLSTNFDVAFHFCTPADAWKNSSLGTKLRCLLVCEVDGQYLADDGQLRNVGANPGAPASSAGLPDTYLLVKSKSAVNISHIIIWNDQAAMHERVGSGISWWWLLVMLYVILMLVLGMRGGHTKWHGH